MDTLLRIFPELSFISVSDVQIKDHCRDNLFALFLFLWFDQIYIL